MTRARGYILVETLTAMAVLSITAAAVQQGVYTAVQARGLAQDYTTAQLLMERLVSTVDLEPRLAAGDVHEGTFPPPEDRFAYTWGVEAVEVPTPSLLFEMPADQRLRLEDAMLTYMGRLRIEIRWARAGQPVSVTGETLIAPERLWFDPIAGPP